MNQLATTVTLDATGSARPQPRHDAEEEVALGNAEAEEFLRCMRDALAALAAGDYLGLDRMAQCLTLHALRGGADRILALAIELQAAARRHDAADAGDLIGACEREWAIAGADMAREAASATH